MTARELYEYALVELNKMEAPSLLLEDYNYFINKAVQQYINLTYAKLEVDQQSTDDLRVLKSTAVLVPKLITAASGHSSLDSGMFKSTYYVDLPEDYMHLINCIVEYEVNSNFKCYDEGDTMFFAARRLTSDLYTQIINNAYMRPTYKRPYYYINTINTSTIQPTAPHVDSDVLSRNGDTAATSTQKAAYYTALANLETAKAEEDKEAIIAAEKALETAKNALGSAVTGGFESSNVDAYNSVGDRLANPSVVRLELRYGRDTSVFIPKTLYIDYIKAPMYIRLTQDQIDATLDYSQVLEFPDYVCFEIANIFTRLLMENASDQRLNTNMPINQTIYNPAIAQAQEARQAKQ